MAMYYYASKLNEASCSNSRRQMRVPPAPTAPIPRPPPPPTMQAPIVADPALLRAGNPLSYYDIQTVIPQRNFAALPYFNFAPERPDIEYRDGQIVTGTLEALIDLLRPGASKTYKFTFFLCSRLFLKPHELLAKLCTRHFKNYDRLKKERGPNDVGILHYEREDMESLVSLFTDWTIMFPYDFRDDRVMALVKIISQRCSVDHMAEISVRMSTILEKLLDKLTALEQYEVTLNRSSQLSSVDHLAPGDILSLGLTPVELASQLTIVELHRLSFVGPEEFLQTFAPHSTTPSSATAANTSIKLHHIESKCTRNLEGYADWFNRLSYLVASDIVKSPKSKYRARVIEQWIMTARECFNLGNFNSLMAIISALNMSPITRLKKTWSRTSSVYIQQLRQLELCIEPSGNHARYRAALAAAPAETAVPLLSVTCRDLHFANHGAPSKLGGNRVNFEKCMILARFVDGQLAGRRLTSDQPPVPLPPPAHRAVWRFLNDRPSLTETGLELTSFEREAPADNHERERLKRLRGSS